MSPIGTVQPFEGLLLGPLLYPLNWAFTAPGSLTWIEALAGFLRFMGFFWDDLTRSQLHLRVPVGLVCRTAQPPFWDPRIARGHALMVRLTPISRRTTWKPIAKAMTTATAGSSQ